MWHGNRLKQNWEYKVVKKAATKTQKQITRKSRVVVEGNEYTSGSEDGFTERVLLSLVVDISNLVSTVERVKIQVFTLAREHGIEPSKL